MGRGSSACRGRSVCPGRDQRCLELLEPTGTNRNQPEPERNRATETEKIPVPKIRSGRHPTDTRQPQKTSDPPFPGGPLYLVDRIETVTANHSS